jgi:hypothetical protein
MAVGVFVITQVTGRVKERTEMGEEAKEIHQLKLGILEENKAPAAVDELIACGIWAEEMQCSTSLVLLRTGRASVAIRRLVRSYIRMPDGQEPAGKVQLDRDQLFARDRFSTDRVFPCVYVFAHPQVE